MAGGDRAVRDRRAARVGVVAGERKVARLLFDEITAAGNDPGGGRIARPVNGQRVAVGIDRPAQRKRGGGGVADSRVGGKLDRRIDGVAAGANTVGLRDRDADEARNTVVAEFERAVVQRVTERRVDLDGANHPGRPDADIHRLVARNKGVVEKDVVAGHRHIGIPIRGRRPITRSAVAAVRAVVPEIGHQRRHGERAQLMNLGLASRARSETELQRFRAQITGEVGLKHLRKRT